MNVQKFLHIRIAFALLLTSAGTISIGSTVANTPAHQTQFAQNQIQAKKKASNLINRDLQDKDVQQIISVNTFGKKEFIIFCLGLIVVVAVLIALVMFKGDETKETFKRFAPFSY